MRKKLVSVILILIIIGFISAISIPKMNGYSYYDDTKVSKESTEISTFICDLGLYYTTKGRFDDNISKMTNEKVVKIDEKTFVYETFNRQGKKQQCVKFKLYNDGRLQITKGKDLKEKICEDINKRIKNSFKIHNFGN